jgi:hypothetical protein
MAQKFKLKEIERITRLVEKDAKFPITDQAQLIEVLGGRGKKVKFHEKDYDLGEAEKIPDFYFPIVSTSDFFTKLADMRGMREEVRDEEGLRPAKQVDPPAGVRPPKVSAPDLPRGDVPSARGSGD